MAFASSFGVTGAPLGGATAVNAVGEVASNGNGDDTEKAAGKVNPPICAMPDIIGVVIGVNG